MYYVYRYVGQNGTVLYVGITNDITHRIEQHKRDKLWKISKSARIEYFAVRHRADADLLETYLISYFKTGQHYNVAKTKKGNVSFLGDCDDIPWVEWDGEVDTKLEPFIIPKQETKFVFSYNPVQDFATTNKAVEYIHWQISYNRQQIQSAIDDETELCDMLSTLTSEERKGDLRVPFEKLVKGIELHKERLSLLKQLKDVYCGSFIGSPEFERISNAILNNRMRILAHES